MNVTLVRPWVGLERPQGTRPSKRRSKPGQPSTEGENLQVRIINQPATMVGLGIRRKAPAEPERRCATGASGHATGYSGRATAARFVTEQRRCVSGGISGGADQARRSAAAAAQRRYRVRVRVRARVRVSMSGDDHARGRWHCIWGPRAGLSEVDADALATRDGSEFRV